MIRNHTQTETPFIPSQRQALGVGMQASKIEGWTLTPEHFRNLSGALCRQDGVDPDLWFTEYTRGKLAAQAACLECPLMAECLTLGLENDKITMQHGVRYGIWGGWSAGMRRNAAHARKIEDTVVNRWPVIQASFREGLWPRWAVNTASAIAGNPMSEETVFRTVTAMVRLLNPMV